MFRLARRGHRLMKEALNVDFTGGTTAHGFPELGTHDVVARDDEAVQLKAAADVVFKSHLLTNDLLPECQQQARFLAGLSANRDDAEVSHRCRRPHPRDDLQAGVVIPVQCEGLTKINRMCRQWLLNRRR